MSYQQPSYIIDILQVWFPYLNSFNELKIHKKGSYASWVKKASLRAKLVGIWGRGTKAAGRARKERIERDRKPKWGGDDIWLFFQYRRFPPVKKFE